MATASDDFNRANGGLGANWSVGGGFQITSNAVDNSNYAADARAVWVGSTFGVDQFSQWNVTVNGSSSNDSGLGVTLRDDNNNNYYRVVIDHGTPNNIGISRLLAGAYVNLAFLTHTFVDGDMLRVEVSGQANVKIEVFINGVSVGSFTDSSGSRLTTGSHVGIFYSSTETSFLGDNWSGGDLVTWVPPTNAPETMWINSSGVRGV